MDESGPATAPGPGGHGEHASPRGSSPDKPISATRAPDGHGAPGGQDGADDGADEASKGGGQRARASETDEI